MPAFVLCLGATECRWAEDDDLGPEEELGYEPLRYVDGSEVKGNTSGVRNAQLLVIRDINAFTDLWLAHAAGISPQPAQPEVTFGERMVIAAFAGERSTGGYTITVEEVRENNEFIAVEIEVRTPGRNCEVSQNVTRPHHMVVLDDSDKPVNFNQTTVRSDPC